MTADFSIKNSDIKEQALRELELIDQINQLVLNKTDLDQVVTSTLDAIIQLFQIEGGRFYLYKESNLELVSRFDNGNVIKVVREMTDLDVATIFPNLEEGTLFSKILKSRKIFVATTKKEIIAAMISYEPKLADEKMARAVLDKTGLKSFVALPLVTDDRVVGLLTLGFKFKIDKTDIQRLERFSRNMTMSLAKSTAEIRSEKDRIFLEDVLANIPIDVAVFDEKQRYMFINKTAISDDDTRDWLIGKTDYDYCEHRSKDKAIADKRSKYLDEVITSRKDVKWVDEHDQSDGNRKYILRHLHPVFKKDKLKYVLGFGVDISDRFLAEQRSKELSEIVSFSNDLIISIGLDKKIKTWNKAGEALLGYTAEEMIGKPCTALVPEELVGEINSVLNKVVCSGFINDYETKRKHKNGYFIDVSMSVFVVKNRKGEIIGFSTIMRDITERKKSVRIMRRNKAILRKAQELAGFGSWDWDIQKDTVQLSDQLYKIFDIKPGEIELNYENFLSLIHPEDRSWVNNRLQLAAETGEPYTFTHRIFDSKKEIRYIESYGSILTNSDGEQTTLYGVVMDTTKRIKTENSRKWFTQQLEKQVEERTEELLRSKDQLIKSLDREKELGKLKSRFVSTASHQFRTPMTVIQANAELLTMIIQPGNEKMLPKLELASDRIKNEVRRMTELIDDVLILGKISEGHVHPKFENTDLKHLIKKLLLQFNSTQDDGRIVEFTVKGKNRKSQIDEILVSNALGNLISNALKYSRTENPKLKLEFEQIEARIEISDNGIGIPKNEIKDLFGPFQRMSNVSNIPGSGLGLSISKEYIELNGGTIDVQSEVRQGSIFTIKLPYIQDKSKKIKEL